MAGLSGAGEGTGVLEIGPGIGVLTVELAKLGGEVTAVELDSRLIPVLAQTLENYRNVQVVNADILKTDIAALIKERFGEKPVYVCANLPYYITSPIIMRLLESRLPIEAVTVMVQKEAADRICAEVGSRDAGALTVAVNYYASAQKLFSVSGDCFMPRPKVDSEVIRLTVRKEPAVAVKSEEFFFSLVKAAFAQRRKTAANGISSGLSMAKEKVIGALEQCGLPAAVRAEALSMEKLAQLSDILYESR